MQLYPLTMSPPHLNRRYGSPLMVEIPTTPEKPQTSMWSPPRGAAALAWAVHALTASGVLVGVAGVFAVLDDKPRLAMLWLIVAQVIDGIDGPIARRIQISKILPQVDGYVMDLIVDYLTCVVVPAIFLHKFGLVPASMSVPAMGLVLFSSALWFSRTELITDDHWFYGFPAVWNLVVPSMFLLGTSQVTNAILVVAFCLLQMTKIQIAHPVQVTEHRKVAIPVTTIWLVTLTLAIYHSDNVGGGVSVIERVVLLAAPAYFAGISIHRAVTRRGAESLRIRPQS